MNQFKRAFILSFISIFSGCITGVDSSAPRFPKEESKDERLAREENEFCEKHQTEYDTKDKCHYAFTHPAEAYCERAVKRHGGDFWACMQVETQKRAAIMATPNNRKTCRTTPDYLLGGVLTVCD